MEKEFVPYPLALILKALGFDEPCMGVYFGNGENELFTFNPSIAKEITLRMVESGHIPCPTFSQVFRWFREKYGVHSSPRKYDETQWWVEWGTWTSSIGTFEEAELAWLEKLIESVEQKEK